jgi:hypothetical protein
MEEASVFHFGLTQHTKATQIIQLFSFSALGDEENEDVDEEA